MTKINSTLENLRVSYQLSSLDINDCDGSPFNQFQHWMNEAIQAECDEPNAFVLSTLGPGGFPRARVVLLKGLEEQNFIFYTNYQSAKGNEIKLHDKVALTFLWLPLQRQVRIEGVVSKVSRLKSVEYFEKRPRGSQIGAIASPQSQLIKSKKELEDLFFEVEKSHSDSDKLKCPDHWGGYAIKPVYFEFWQGRPNRMHDRICYEVNGEHWSKFRLAP
jgi:pyridoxamine 5'-phosphate oxidase